MTDPVLRGAVMTVTTSTSTSLPATMPTHLTGDLLVAEYDQRGSTAAPSMNTGWVQQHHASGSNGSGDVWSKIAASGAETLTVTKPSGDPASVTVKAYQVGTFDTTQPFESFTSNMALGSDSTPPLPESTSTVDGSMLNSFAGIRSGSTSGSGLTKPSSWTASGSAFANNGTNGLACGSCVKRMVTAGPMGSDDWSGGPTNSGPMISYVVRSAPAAPPATSAPVYWWNGSAYVLAAGVKEWDGAAYHPSAAAYDDVAWWDDASGQYFPGGTADTTAPTAPGAITSTGVTSTTITFSWGPSTDTVGVTGYRIRLNGGSWVDEPTTSHPFTGLTASTAYTPEVQARDAAGNWSTTTTGSTVTTPAAPDVTPPTTPGTPTATPTGSSVALAWTASTDAVGVTAYDVHRSATTGFTPAAGTLKASPATNSYTETNVPNGTWYYKIIARDAAGNASTASAQRSVVVAATSTILVGCSDSENDHGGTEDWDGWREYTRSSMYTRANQTGSLRPLFLMYSEDGPNLGYVDGLSYTQIYNKCIIELDTFYYGNAAGTLGSGTGSSTPSVRAAIQLYWSNGNENSDKGDLSLPHTPAKIAAYVTSQRALYDACMYAPGGTRRFPNAFAGSDPTQNHELSGIVADWLHPSAQYHHFVGWSGYNPGRQSTVDDPTMNWPTISKAVLEGSDTANNKGNAKQGFLGRCFSRTDQARAQARIDTGDPTFDIKIGIGEIGTGDTPGDTTARPYYAALGLLGACFILGDEYDLEVAFFNWWDNQKKLSNGDWDTSAPQDILGHGTANGVTVYGEPAGTNPSTRQALQAWPANDPRRGGTLPDAWVGNPKSSWKHTGTPVA